MEVRGCDVGPVTKRHQPLSHHHGSDDVGLATVLSI